MRYSDRFSNGDIDNTVAMKIPYLNGGEGWLEVTSYNGDQAYVRLSDKLSGDCEYMEADITIDYNLSIRAWYPKYERGYASCGVFGRPPCWLPSYRLCGGWGRPYCSPFPRVCGYWGCSECYNVYHPPVWGVSGCRPGFYGCYKNPYAPRRNPPACRIGDPSCSRLYPPRHPPMFQPPHRPGDRAGNPCRMGEPGCFRQLPGHQVERERMGRMEQQQREQQTVRDRERQTHERTQS